MFRFNLINRATIGIVFTLFTVTVQSQQEIKHSKDTLSKIITDDYPITDSMLTHNTGKCGDYCWFKNEELNQTIAIVLYTDYHRLCVFHFHSNIVNPYILELMEMNTTNGDIANDDEKIIIANSNINKAEKISAKYFTSKKGVDLGSQMRKSVTLYGAPLKREVRDDFEILSWKFDGDILNDASTVEGKPLAENSYGYEVVMVFKKEKLVGQAILNNVP